MDSYSQNILGLLGNEWERIYGDKGYIILRHKHYGLLKLFIFYDDSYNLLKEQLSFQNPEELRKYLHESGIELSDLKIPQDY